MARRRAHVCAALTLLAPLLATLASPPAAVAAAGDISTVAGGLGEGPALQVAQRVRAMVGRGPLVYMGDETKHVVRVLDTTTGLQRIVAGNGTYDGQGPDALGDGGPATSASLGYVSALALDAAGNLYIADGFHFRIRKLEPSGRITIIAGNGTEGDGGDGGPARSASLKYLWGMGFDQAGNLYVSTNSRIRKIDTAGTITTVAGIGTVDVAAGSSPDGIPATQAQINTHDLAVDGQGNLYFGDGLSLRVRKVDQQGILRTYAHVCGTHLTRAPDGVLYVSGCGRVHKIDPSGQVVHVAGTGAYGSSGDGGLATQASLKAPGPLALDGAGNLYLSDVNDYRVRRVNSAGVIHTVAGNGTFSFAGDGGPATQAQLNSASDVALDPSGNIYIADWANQRVRRVDSAGVITTFAGNGEDSYSGDGGPATAAAISYPSNVVVDGAGNVYIASYLDFRVRKVTPGGVISTVAGNGARGYSGDGGPATLASIGWIGGLAVDIGGNLYITDNGGHRVRKVDTGGTITTVAGTGESGFAGDGGDATGAKLYYPNGIAVDSAGNLFIADTYNGRIRKVSPDGSISTVALTGFPLAVTSDNAGGLFVGDDTVVLRVTSAGTATVAGTGVRGYSGDGGPAARSQLSGVGGLAFDGSDLYVADTLNARIRKVASAGTVLPTTTTTSSTTSTSTTTSTTSSTTTTTTVPPSVSPQNPYSVWNQPASTPLDGIGSWVATANDPAPGAGQLPPAYVYGQVFGFANSSAAGTVALVTAPTGKAAVFTVREPNGTSHDVVVAFSWTAGRLYFPLVYRLGPGRWGAWVYDHATSAWTAIGELQLPDSWGKLAPTSLTTVGWFGGTAASCSAFPRADVLNHPPTGFVGGTATTASLGTNSNGPGSCPAQTTIEFDAWARYRVGASLNG
jgi:sugar lactone lactonase YvrE